MVGNAFFNLFYLSMSFTDLLIYTLKFQVIPMGDHPTSGVT